MSGSRGSKLFLAVISLAGVVPAQRIITTYAGAEWIFPPNVTKSNATPASVLHWVAVDGQGNFYAPDSDNNVVYKADRSGNVRVIAGNGLRGFSGDGGQAANASLNSPTCVVVDAQGNVFIGDNGNNRIRRVALDGTIGTVVGNGINFTAGDGLQAFRASFSSVFGLAFDGTGSLYFTDMTANRIRRVDPLGFISTFAGNGMAASAGDNLPATQASLNQPWGITVSAAGDVYVAEYAGYKIRRITSGLISTFAGTGSRANSGDGGPAIQANLQDPVGLGIDGLGNLLVGTSSAVRRITPSGIISSVAGTGTPGFGGDGGAATSASFYFAQGIAVAGDGTVFVADEGNHRIRSFRPGGTISTVLGSGGYKLSPPNATPTQTFLGGPDGLRLDARGNLLFTDSQLSILRAINPSGVSVSLKAGKLNLGGCCTDGGSALNAILLNPGGIWTLSDGTIFLADRGNNRIRSISPGGTITSIAGGSSDLATAGFSGDGGPAANAAINGPQDVVVDSKGNLYFSDQNNNRIRRITPDGKISTFAGNGTPGYSGDGNGAVNAMLTQPNGLAIDSTDNLYIADFGNHVIRKVTPGGVIQTVAGNGVGTPISADGSMAVKAAIGSPTRLALDPANNLLFTDSINHAVRRLNSNDGTLLTLAGNGNSGFSGDGGSATSASLNGPEGIAVAQDGTIYIADTQNNKIRAILNISASIQLSQTSLTFSAKSAGAPTPAQVVTVTSRLSNTASTGLGFSGTISPGAANWLQVVGSGRTPQDLQIVADPTNVAAGNYQGTITISAPGASNSPQSIGVTFRVLPADPTSKLSVNPGNVSLSVGQGSLPVSALLSISNVGSGVLNYKVVVALGGSWLSLSSSTNLTGVAPGVPSNLTITADPSSLSPGSYTGRIDVTNTTNSRDTVQSVGVFLTVGSQPRSILLSQTGLTFTAVIGGGSPLSKNFGILNIGSGSLDWSAQVTAPDGTSVPWLQLSTYSGTVARPYLDVSLVDVSVNAAALPNPGTYLGQIRIRADADNSPQSLTVVVNVLPAGSKGPLEIRPSGLIFTGLQGSSPSSQTIQLATENATQATYRSGTITGDGTNWLMAAPNTGSLQPSNPGRMIIQPDFSTLSPGLHFGTVTFLFLEDGSSQLVNVLAVVAPPGTVFKNADAATGNDAIGCTPKNLNLLYPNKSDFTSVVVGNPVNFEVQVTDDCGSPVNSTQSSSVNASFGNGDPILRLVPTANGKWSRTWTPKAAGSGTPPTTTITTTAFAVVNRNILTGQSNVNVNISQGSPLPIVSSGGVVNAASFAADTPVAPGSLISIFGTAIADPGAGQAVDVVPIPTSLNGAEVRLNDQPLPLSYASDGQINAQIPYGLPVNTQQQILVRRGNLLSSPEAVLVAAAQPGIFRTGVGDQGVILNSSNALADSKNPVHTDDVVVIYCTGLGAVSPAVVAGQPAPSNPLGRTVTVATVTIGGLTATVDFSGLTPNFAGLYQVNVHVPAGVTPGDAVPVTLSILGQTSPPVTISVR